MAEFDPWAVDGAEFPRHGSERERIEFLLRYAILAPSTRNTQPWKFAVEGARIRVFGDPGNWQKVADPSRRELYLSVGCALENLLVAAEGFGYRTEVAYEDGAGHRFLAAVVTLHPDGTPDPQAAALLAAIPRRHTNHRPFQERPVPAAALDELRRALRFSDIGLALTDDGAVKQAADELLDRADDMAFADPAFRAELSACLAQGAFGAPWLVSRLESWAVANPNLGRAGARQRAKVLVTAPFLGVITAGDDSRPAWVRAGQALERLWLAADALGLSLHPVSQMVQVPEIRAEFARLMKLDGVAAQPFRLGYAAAEPKHTPRRPLDDVLVRPNDLLALL